MMLKEILKDCDYTGRSLKNESFMDIDITGIAYDSRKVKCGYLFVAIKGEKYDGHDFVRDATKKGAAAIVMEKELSGIESGFILVEDGRTALACISNNFYERPSESLTLVGITGTNGKTTTTYILKSIFEAWGKDVGLVGTIQYLIKDRVYPAPHTTPESPEFQGLLREMFLSGCTHVVSEVSSHALAQYRVDGAVFRTAIFTNLTRDHLDFHRTMEDYFRAKKRLFSDLIDKDGTAVINLDDPYGKRLESELRGSRQDLKIVTYGLESGADIVASGIESSFEGLEFRMTCREGTYRVASRLTGVPNVYNIISAAGASISLGVPWQVIIEGIEKAEHVTGRFEKVDAGQKFLCIVDYAHTEDALERLILTARDILRKSKGGTPKSGLPYHIKGRVITVFGCGGDRDRGKRPGMGDVATRLSDFVIITSDNPRSEDPSDIIRDIEAGATAENYLLVPDRREAVTKAVEMAEDGDIVLIAGKGHEDYQEIKGVRYPFSDGGVVKAALKNRLKMQN